jgi:hypothetical protein
MLGGGMAQVYVSDDGDDHAPDCGSRTLRVAVYVTPSLGGAGRLPEGDVNVPVEVRVAIEPIGAETATAPPSGSDAEITTVRTPVVASQVAVIDPVGGLFGLSTTIEASHIGVAQPIPGITNPQSNGYVPTAPGAVRVWPTVAYEYGGPGAPVL